MEMIFQELLFTQTDYNIYYSELQYMDFLKYFPYIINGFCIVSQLLILLVKNAKSRWLDYVGVL